MIHWHFKMHDFNCTKDFNKIVVKYRKHDVHIRILSILDMTNAHDLAISHVTTQSHKVYRVNLLSKQDLLKASHDASIIIG